MQNCCPTAGTGRSPSMRREWIEILHDFSIPRSREVSLHAEGVD